MCTILKTTDLSLSLVFPVNYWNILFANTYLTISNKTRYWRHSITASDPVIPARLSLLQQYTLSLGRLVWHRYPDRHGHIRLLKTLWHGTPPEITSQGETIWSGRQDKCLAMQLPYKQKDASSHWWWRIWSSPVDSGVPQGTVLGPLLFLCHINDLPDAVKFTLRLFADNCLLYWQIKSREDHISLLPDLQNLETWAKTWECVSMPRNATLWALTSNPRISTSWMATSYNRFQKIPTYV